MNEVEAVARAVAPMMEGGREFDLDAAAAVIAADRAGLVARIAELEGVLKRCAQIVELHNWRQAEKVDDVKIIARTALGASHDADA